MSENQPQRQTPIGRFMSGLLSVDTDDPVRLRRGRLVNIVLLAALAVSVAWLVVTGLRQVG